MTVPINSTLLCHGLEQFSSLLTLKESVKKRQKRKRKDNRKRNTEERKEK
jgi:hypothetical protein